MKMKSFFLILCGLGIGWMANASAKSLTPKEIVEEIFEKTTKEGINKNQKLQREVNAHFDFDHMGKEALGSKYKAISAKERAWFTRTLKKLITKSVYPNALEFFEGVEIDYEDVESKKASATLMSTLTKKGEETEVVYFFKKKSGKWRLIDVSIDEESWIENMRDEVHSILKKEKWAGLKRRMNKRLVNLDKEKK